MCVVVVVFVLLCVCVCVRACVWVFYVCVLLVVCNVVFARVVCDCC